MLKKILKKLTNNLGFKLLAVLFAFAMWLVVYNIDDPSSSKNFTATVTIQNAQSVSDMNKCYEVIDGTGTVSFRVTAKRSILEKLDYSDFTAIADMSRGYDQTETEQQYSDGIRQDPEHKGSADSFQYKWNTGGYVFRCRDHQ